MHTRISLCTLAIAAFVGAQKSSAPDTTSTTPTSLATSTVHTVLAGKGGDTFSPRSITARVGDQVEFHFVSSHHNVAAGDFGNPCQPLDDSSFYSGYIKPGHSFTITVNDTDPIRYYCTAPDHCQNGMVGVINPPAGQTIDEYARAASKTNFSVTPDHVQGGTLGSSNHGSGSGSSSGSATTSISTATSTSSTTPTASPSKGAAALKRADNRFGVTISIVLAALSLF